MTEPPDRRRLEGIFLIVLALLITAVFFQMVRGFIESLFLAAVFSGMLYGLYRRLARRLGGRKPTAAVLTILLFVLALIVPLSAFLGLVVSQAIEVSTSVGPWVENELTRPNQIDGLLQRLPFWETIQPYQDLISTKAAELAGHMGTFLVASVATGSQVKAASVAATW